MNESPAPNTETDVAASATARGWRPDWRAWAMAALIVAAAAAAYANSFAGVFVYDDLASIRDNPFIRRLWPLSDAMSLPLWNTGQTVDGRPVLSLSLAINRFVFGPEPWGYHLVNLAIHVCAALALFGIVRRTAALERFGEPGRRASSPAALAVALLWVVHPLNTQAVTYLVQRAESLMGLFYLLTVYCAIRGFGSGRRTRWYAAAVVACALGTGTKESIVTAPVAVLLYDALFVGGSLRAGLRKRWRLYAAFAVSLLLLAPAVLGANQGKVTDVKAGAWPYLLTQTEVLLHYLRLVFWPAPLVMHYGWTLATSLLEVVVPILAIAAMLGLVVWGLVRRSWWGYAGAWFFLTLAPTSSFPPLRFVIWDYRMYVPLAGVVALVVVGAGWLLGRLASGAGRRALQIAGAAMVAVAGAALGWATHRRNIDYHSVAGLWEQNLRADPRSDAAQNNYGKTLTDRGRIDEAMEYYQRAVRLNPHNAQAWGNIGGVLFLRGQYRQAVPYFERAIANRGRNALAHFQLGGCLQRLGELDRAAEHLATALRYNPWLDGPDYALGLIRRDQGRVPEAIKHLQRAAVIDPDWAAAHANLGLLLARAGRSAEAIEHLGRAVEIDPNQAGAHHNLAMQLATAGQTERAIHHFGEAIRLAPRHVEARVSLSNVLYETGRTREAIGLLLEVLGIAPAHDRAHLNLGVIHSSRREHGKAIAHLKRALEINPKLVEAQFNLGVICARRGQIDDAIGHFTEALKINPRLVPGHRELGRLYLDKGDLAKSRHHLEKVRELTGKPRPGP